MVIQQCKYYIFISYVIYLIFILLFRANEAFNSIKSSYGVANCFLLRMNSRPPGASSNEHLPDPWSQFLNGKIDTKSYQVTPECSPGPTRHLSLEIGQEANENKSLNYHPLSPEVEDLTVVRFSKLD